MKNLISAFLILFISISLFSQPILHDTILEQQGEFCLLRIYADNGYYNNFFVKGAPEEIEVNFSGSEPESTPASVTDQLEATLWLPDPKGGVMPEDIVYNPVSGKYYIFGNRRLAVVDPQTNDTETALTVSDHGFSVPEGSLYYSTCRLAVDEQQNLVYCATYDLEILAIDCSANQVVQTYTENTLTQPLGIKMLFDPVNRRLFWLLASWDGYSKLKVYDLNAGTSYEKFFDDQVFDMVLRTDGSRIYVSTSQDFITLDCADLSEYNSYHTTDMRLVYNEDTDEVAGHGSLIVNFFSGETGAFITSVASPFSLALARCMSGEEETISISSKVFYTGYVFPVYKVMIINGSTHTVEEILSHPANFPVYSMVYDAENYKVFAAGSNLIFDIDVTSNLNIHYGDLTGCTSEKLLIDPVHQGGLLSIHRNEGTFCEIDIDCTIVGGSVRQIGMSSFISVYNSQNHKVYFISSDSYYERSTASIYNSITNAFITTCNIGDRALAAEYNYQANKVFVSCFDGQYIRVIEGASDNSNSTIDLSSYNLSPKTLISYEDKVYAGTFEPGGNGKIIAIDANTLEWSIVKENIAGIPSTVIRDDYNNRAFFTYDYDAQPGRLISIDLTTGTYLTQTDFGFCPMTSYPNHPISIAYSPTNNNIYVGLHYCNEFYILDADDLSTDKVLPLAQNIKYMAYDSYRKLVYVSGYQSFSPNNYIAIIDCKINEVVKTMAVNYNSYLMHNGVNDQVYLHSLMNPGTENQVEVSTVDCLWNNTLTGVGTGNYFDGPYNISNAQRLRYSDYACNPETNKLYVPNLAFSNASVIQCHIDKLQLKGQYTWISFPRMERTDDNPFGSQAALDHRVEPWAPNYMKLQDKWANWIKYVNEPTPTWVPYGLEEVQTTFGYILEADWGEGPPPKLRLEGAKLDPTWPVQLQGPEDNENWLGYFYENPSWYWECIPQWMLDELIIEIKTQYWSMIRTCPPPQGDCWLFDGSVRPFSYGDLVVIRANLEEGETETFSWLTGGQGEGGQDRPPRSTSPIRNRRIMSLSLLNLMRPQKLRKWLFLPTESARALQPGCPEIPSWK